MTTTDDKTTTILTGALRLAEGDKEVHARAYLKEQLPHLPQDVRDAIAIEALFGAVSKQAREIARIRKGGMLEASLPGTKA